MSLIVVSVGTDHHPFDRMIDWIDSCEVPELSFIIQSGTSKKSTKWESHELIPHAELLELFESSAAVVCHGGPSTVMDARLVGKKPIVLPRNPEHGEHIDGHQMAFAEHMAQHDVSTVVSTRDELLASVAEAVSNPAAYAVDLPDGALPGVIGFGNVVDSLLGIKTPITSSQSQTEEIGKA